MSDLTNAAGIPVTVDQGESIVLAATFYDPDGNQFNKAALSAVTVTLLDEDNEVINSREDQNVIDANGGTLATDGSFELALTPADNPIVDETNAQEEHTLILKWQWVDGASVTQTGIQKYDITVVNTESSGEAVIPPEIVASDLSGIKRVKTKHIEVESHDPRAVQEARAKENTPLPSFCSSHFCIGTPRTTRRYE